MNSKSLTQYYVWAIKALIFVTPFLSVWIANAMFFPYITGRNFAFRILVEIALVLWLALAVLNKEYRPKFTPIVWALVIFTFIVGAANLLGVDAYNSFWSRFERMEGYLMILHLVAYFFITTSVFRSKKDWLTFFNLVIIAGILVGGYGVLQLLGIKSAIQGGGVRIDGTIGNPTYLAAYLTLVIALSLILFFNASQKWLKYFYGGAIVFNFFVMFFTASRGAAFALLVTIPLFLIFYLIFYRKTDDPKERLFKKVVIAALALMVILPSSIWLLRNSSLVKNSTVLSRITSVSFQERTIKSRFQIWGIAWKAFKERPLLGWGQENFLQAFSKYFDPRLYDQEPWFDRPHNIIFEWLINAGILGLIAYLSLFVTFFWVVARLLKNGIIGKKEGLVLITVPIAYFLQNFFVFDNFNTYILFFGLLAYVNSLIVHRETGIANEKEADTMPSIWTLSGGLLAAAVLMYSVNFLPIAQSQGIISALQATADNTDPIGKALAEFQRALSYNSFGEAEVLEQLTRTAGLLVGQSNLPNNSKLPFLQYSVTQLSNYLKMHPDNIRLHLMLGSLYQSMRSLNQQFIFLAREEIKSALALSPSKQQILFLLADNYLSTNEIDKAIELLQKAANLEPNYVDARVNLALIGIYSKRSQLVSQSIKDLNEIRLHPSEGKTEYQATRDYLIALKRIAEAYLQTGQRTNASDILNAMKSLESEIVRTNGDLPDFKAIIEIVAGEIRK